MYSVSLFLFTAVLSACIGAFTTAYMLNSSNRLEEKCTDSIVTNSITFVDGNMNQRGKLYCTEDEMVLRFGNSRSPEIVVSCTDSYASLQIRSVDGENEIQFMASEQVNSMQLSNSASKARMRAFVTSDEISGSSNIVLQNGQESTIHLISDDEKADVLVRSMLYDTSAQFAACKHGALLHCSKSESSHTMDMCRMLSMLQDDFGSGP